MAPAGCSLSRRRWCMCQRGSTPSHCTLRAARSCVTMWAPPSRRCRNLCLGPATARSCRGSIETPEHAKSALQATVLPQTVLTLLHRTWHRTQVRQIHRRLPPGGVLVFVTGQREVEHLVARLRTALAPAAASTAAPHADGSDRPPTPAEEVRAAAPGGPCPSTA